MVTIRSCTIDELEHAPNIQALMDEYAAESAIEGLPHPSAKAEAYKQLEATGWLHTIAAYIDAGLVGFILILTHTLPHYNTRVSMTESFFVSKIHRKSGAGVKLLQAAEDHAREAGIPGFLITAPTGGVLAKGLEKNKAYTETNRVYFKRFA